MTTDARRMGKSEIVLAPSRKRFEVKAHAGFASFFDELTALAEKELKRSGEFVLPGMVKLVVQKRKAGGWDENPATGEGHQDSRPRPSSRRGLRSS